MKRIFFIILITMVLLLSFSLATATTAFAVLPDPGDPSGLGIEPTVYLYSEGSRGCADFGYTYCIKFEDDEDISPGEHTATISGFGTITYTVDSNGVYFDWGSTFPISAGRWSCWTGCSSSREPRPAG